MSFGKNMGYYRRKLKITQEELAERLYVSRQTVSRWETDAILPDVETIVKLCELFDCDMDTLVRGDAESKENAAAQNLPEHTAPCLKRGRSSADWWWMGERINIAVNSTIMILAMLVFFFCGILWGLWHPAWIAFLAGALLCGISSIIVHAIFQM